MWNNSKMAAAQHFFLYCGNVAYLATTDNQDLELSSLDTQMQWFKVGIFYQVDVSAEWITTV